MSIPEPLRPAGLGERISADLDSAVAAREVGNEGKVRVSARRAVGWAIQAYYSNHGVELPSKSAIAHIQYMIEDIEITDDIVKMLPHFIRRLKKDSLDEDSYWPLDIDLIDEARQVINHLNKLSG